MSRNCVVVGASRGIGREIVRELAKNPLNNVIALSRSENVLQNFSDLNNVSAFCLDIESENLQSELSDLLSAYKNIHVLINNAGYLVKKPFMELNREDLEKSYSINVFGLIASVQAVLPKMEEEGGHIVNISSMGGFQGSVKFPGLTAYSTSKAAVCSFTELFAEEYKESKIKMNCLCLGAAQTEMLEAAFPGYEAPLTAQQMAEYIADFSLNGMRWFNGKIIPVSLSTP